MRVWIPSGAGLGAPEISALRRLSRPSLQFIADELHEPGSHEAIRWVLRQPNPERALAQAIAENVEQATSDLVRHVRSGGLHGISEDGGMGKSFFKKFVKFNRKIFNTLKKVNAKIAKIDPIYKATAKIRKRVMNEVRKLAPVLIMTAGIVVSIAFPALAPLMALASSALTTAYKLRAAKINADKAKRAGKAEANLMQAQVNQQTAQVNAQADQIYAGDGHSTFLAAGYDQTRWNALTLDQKIDLIQQAASGTLKPDPAAVAALQAAQTQVADSATQTAVQAAAQQSPPPPSGMPDTSGAAPDSSSSGPFQNVIASSASTPAAAPPSYTTGTDETAGLPSAGGYTVNVEGQPITNYPLKSMSDVSGVVASGTQPGDRFEILADGQPTGLRVRTASGFISIPESARAKVMAMPHDQVLALLTQAASNVADQGGPQGPPPAPAQASPSGGGSGLLWLLLAGGAAVAISGVKRGR